MRKCYILRVSLLLLCTLYASLTFAQDRKITGTVTDERQALLAGATVTVKGTKIVTTTDVNGKFSVNAPTNANVLIISYVGMQTQEVAIGTDNVVTAALVGTSGTMTDVVVTGYGRSRRANLTTAQTTVSAVAVMTALTVTVRVMVESQPAALCVVNG